MLIFLVLLVNCYSWHTNNILLVYSDSTPSSLLHLFAKYELTLKIDSGFSVTSVNPNSQVLLILDLSLDSNLFWVLDSLSNLLKVNYFTITRAISSSKSQYRYQIHCPLDYESDLLFNLITYFQWSTFSVFSSTSKESQKISENLKKKFQDSQIKSFTYNQNITESQTNTIVKKFVKVTGTKNLLIIDQEQSLQHFVESMKKLKISSYGSYFLFSSHSVYLVNIPGAVLLTEPGTEDSVDFDSYEYNALNNVINKFKVFSDEEFEKICPGQNCMAGLNIVNVGDLGEVKTVGTVFEQVKIDEPMMFPGNNSLIKADVLNSVISLSIANGTSEPYGLGTSSIASRAYVGSIFAVSQSNKLREIENFEFQLNPTDCGNYIFDFKWYSQCLNKLRNSLGTAYLTGYTIFGAYGNLITLRILGINVPQISPYAFSNAIDNSTAYPEFIRMSPKLNIFIYNSVLIYMSFHWKDFIIFTVDDVGFLGLYNQFLLAMEAIGARYINPEPLRIFPSNYTIEDFDQYKSYFQYVKDSKCRLIHIISSISGEIIEGLYDIGLRKGDIIIMGSWQLYYTLYDNIPESRLNKRKELLEGALLTSFYEYQTELGKQVQTELSELYSDIKFLCITYDTFLVVKNAIQHLINAGEDFDDHSLLIRAMRTQKFTGCSGDVFFSEESNSRATSISAVDQVVYNKTLQKYTSVTLALANKFSIVTLKYLRSPVWPSGLPEFPSNYIQASKCGFKDSQKQKCSAGQTQILIVSAVYLGITVVSAYLSYKTFNCNIESMSEKVHATYNDKTFIFFFVLEFFQIITLEPANGIFAKNLNSLQFFVGFDFIEYFNFQFSDFWKVYFVLIIVSTVFVVMAAIVFVLRKFLIRSSRGLYLFGIFSETILPFIGHVGFFPITLQLLMIFDCGEGIGDTLLDGFMKRDCSEFCYQGKHKLYVIPSSIVIFLFLFTSTFLRPFWEISQINLHLKTRPIYLSLLSIFQVLLICINLNIKVLNETIAGFTLTGVFIVIILLTIRIKPYNYERAIVYQLFVLIIACWIILVSSFSLVFDNNSIIIPLYFGGILVFFILGAFITFRYPKRFFEDEGGLIPVLIKFQFSRRTNNIVTKSKYFAHFSGIRIPGLSTHNFSS